MRTLTTYQAIILATAAILGSLINIYTYENRFNGPPIRSDGFGYYVYLPALFLHGDPYFTFLEPPLPESVSRENFFAQPLPLAELGLSRNSRGYANKYPIGTAVMQAPFFLAALVVANESRPTVFGFEDLFQYANALSALAYLLAGIIILMRTAESICVSLNSFLLMIFVLLATNLPLYASYDGSFSHVYSFFLCSVALAIVFSGRFSKPSIGRYLLLGATIGLATIVRPTNVMLCLLLLVTPPTQGRLLLTRWSAFGFGFLIAVAPQLAFWYATTGQLIYYSYGNEGFDFSAPQMMNYLFSIRKGMFFWHPAYLILFLASCFAAFARDRRILVAVGIFVISVYVNSTWHAWYFGGSFGSRPAIDTLPLLVIGAAFALRPQHFGVKQLIALAVPVSLVITMNLIQMHGYIIGTIPFDSSTWESYSTFWRAILAPIQPP